MECERRLARVDDALLRLDGRALRFGRLPLALDVLLGILIGGAGGCGPILRVFQGLGADVFLSEELLVSHQLTLGVLVSNAGRLLGREQLGEVDLELLQLYLRLVQGDLVSLQGVAGIGKIGLGLGYLRDGRLSGRFERGLRRPYRLYFLHQLGVQPALGDDGLLSRLLQLRLGGREVRLRLGDFFVDLLRVDRREDVAHLDEIAVLDVQLEYLAFDVGLDLYGDQRFEGAGFLDADGEWPRAGLFYPSLRAARLAILVARRDRHRAQRDEDARADEGHPKRRSEHRRLLLI